MMQANRNWQQHSGAGFGRHGEEEGFGFR